jgi:TonB family protein
MNVPRSLAILVSLVLLVSACRAERGQVPAAPEPNGQCSRELIAAVHSENVANVKNLLDRGASVNCAYRLSGEADYTSPLDFAVKAGRLDLLQMILAGGAEASNEVLALHDAVRPGKTTILEALLAAGADPNGVYVRTALGEAFAQGNIEGARVLLDHGADPNKTWCSRYAELDSDLGEKPGCSWDCQLTPLMVGAAAGAGEFVRLLLAAGADPALRDRKGRSALDFAKRYQHPEIVARLETVTPSVIYQSRAKRTRYVAPIYPQLARTARVEGIVGVFVSLTSDGHVTDADVVCSIPLLDDAALDAVSRWRYERPQGNDPVRFLVQVPFELSE